MEYLRAAGPGYLRAFARLARRSLQDGAPSRWRTGCAVPVPKKQRVRSVLRTPEAFCWRATWARSSRELSGPRCSTCLPEAAKFHQSGGVKGGSTAAQQLVLSLFIKKVSKETKCAGSRFHR